MSIHHAVTKRAAKFGVKLQEPQHGYWVATVNGKDFESSKSATDALEQAIATLPKPEKAARKPKAKKPAKRKARSSNGDEEGDSEDEEGGKSVIAPKYKKKYRPNKDSCGDKIRDAVWEFLHPDGEDVDVVKLNKLGKDNGIDVMDRWGAKNVGMRVMNTTNVLRGMLRRGLDVKIGGTTIAGSKKKD